MDAGDDLVRPDHPDHRPGQERPQPEQPDHDRRLHVPRPVPRPRHDVRPDVEPGPPAGPGVDPQLPHPGARPRQRLRRRPGRQPAPLRPERRRRPDDACSSRRSPARPPCRSTATPRYDLPRNSQNVALIGDPRNDENLIVSPAPPGLAAVPQPRRRRRQGRARRRHTPLEEIFAEAQRVVRWHYQWLVLHEFLPTTVGDALTDDDPDQRAAALLRLAQRPLHPRRVLGRRLPLRPLAGAAQLPRATSAPSAADPTQQFFALIFEPGDPNPADPDDLRGGCRAPRRFIDWQTFFDFGDGRVRPNKMIDTKLSSDAVPPAWARRPATPDSLATRNLLRNLTMKVPSGQSVAKAMQLPVLAPSDLADLAPHHLDKRTPLWFYVLREAQVTGRRRAPRSGRRADRRPRSSSASSRATASPTSARTPTWTPTYGSRRDVHDDRPPDQGGGRRLALLNAYPVCVVSGTVGR